MDPVNKPDHYTQAGVECLDVIEAILTKDQFTSFLWASSFQYIWRCWHKGNALQDLRKADFYLNKLIERLEK